MLTGVLTRIVNQRGGERGGRPLIGAGAVALLLAGAGYTVTVVNRLRDRN